LNNESDLTITCQNKSAWLYPQASYLRIGGNFKTAGGANVANNSAVTFINNCIYSQILYITSKGKNRIFSECGHYD